MTKDFFLTRKLKTLLPALILGGFVMLYADTAHAQIDKNTLGAVLINTINSFQTVPGLLVGFSYLFAIILGFMGILKLKEHVESPNQVPIWDPIKRFMAGGSLFALPTVVDALRTTVSFGIKALKGSDFNTGGVSGKGLDASLVSLMQNIWGPMQDIFAMFGYLAGLVLIIIGVSRLLKTEQEGPRGPMGFGTIMTFLVGGVLLSHSKILSATVGSLFDGKVRNFATLAYDGGMSSAAVGHAEAVVGAILAFVAILGWISFFRGFFIMRGVAEGNSQASAMAGFTHIIGGALAVNLGGFIRVVQNSLGISDYGLKVSDAAQYLHTITSFA